MKNKKILIIEDSDVQRAVIVNLVKELGYEPFAIEAFEVSVSEYFRDNDISVVLLDLMLLKKDGTQAADGFQICNEIKEENPAVKVIIVSAEDDEAAREFAMLQGADGYLAKPFRIEDLDASLRALC